MFYSLSLVTNSKTLWTCYMLLSVMQGLYPRLQVMSFIFEGTYIFIKVEIVEHDS